MAYFETSAKDNLNVDKAFEEVARLAFKREAKDEELYTIISNKLDIFQKLLISRNPKHQIKVQDVVSK
jgi:GTPase SAR1 family protein